MAKRGGKLDPKTRSDIIGLAKSHGTQRVAGDLGVSRSTVKRVLEQEAEVKVVASRSFLKHGNDVSNFLRYILSNRELSDSSAAHFKQEYPEYAHLNSWQDISKEDIEKGILDKMELMANTRSFKFCAKCPICRNIERQLRKSA